MFHHTIEDPDDEVGILSKKSLLSPQELIELQEMIAVWVPNLGYEFIDDFNSWLRNPEDGLTKHNWVIKDYVRLLKPHAKDLGILDNNENSEELITSGLFCFLGQIIFHLCHHDSDKIYSILDSIFDFVLLYIHVDHFLDNVKIDEEYKNNILNIMMILLINPRATKPPSKMEGLVNSYANIIERFPESKKWLVRLFKTEVEALSYQNTQLGDSEIYLKIAEMKGGRTAHAIQACIGDIPDKYGYQIGACVQLLDDLMDVCADLENGLFTLATIELRKHGKLDHLVYYTAKRIFNLHSDYNVFKFLMMEILTYSISQHDCFSDILKKRLKKFMHIRYDKGSKMMDIVNAWVKNHILESND